VHSLDQLNTQFWRWVEVDYHQRPHSALGDQTPAARFAQAGHSLRTLGSEVDVDRLFLMRVERRVRKDATISLEAALWALWRSSSFEEGALAAVNLGDDADTTGAVYGQLAGAAYGLSGIPAGWLDKLAWRERIHATADALCPAP